MKEDVPQEQLKSMSLGDHIDELRYRLIMAIAGALVVLAICLFFGEFFFKLIYWSYEKAMVSTGQPPTLQAIRIPEKFAVYIKTCFVFALIFASPWIFYHIWSFISAGLYSHERKFVRIIAPASALLFISGAAFFIFVAAPITIGFLVGFSTGVDSVEVKVTLQECISFVLSLTLIFGLAFQMPLAIIFTERIGLLKLKTLTSVRRYVVFALFAIAAIVTPPDVVSQVALAVPLYILYEASILICWLWRKRSK